MVGHVSMEVAKTVLEVADVAWSAVECCHHHHDTAPSPPEINERGDFDIEALRSENERLRQLLEKNLNLLQHISSSPTLLHNCPSDLHDRILSAVNSEGFLNELESLRRKSTCSFPFDEPSGADLEKAEVLINVDNEEPSWWVWVSGEMVPNNIEEKSGIDNENYVIVSEEHVVDGVATFMARCILANPESLSLSPVELQKALMKSLGGMNKLEKMLNIWHAGKMFYTLATWGLALTGFTRATTDLLPVPPGGLILPALMSQLMCHATSLQFFHLLPHLKLLFQRHMGYHISSGRIRISRRWEEIKPGRFTDEIHYFCLYQGRAILKLATLGVHHSSKMALKVLV